MPSDRTDVLIVGGGPVGLALSIDLAWRGIAHVLVDRDPREARRDHPRMDQVGVRSMEHFRRLGVVGAIEAAGFPRDLPRDVVFCTGVIGHELAREPFAADAFRAPPPVSPQKHELCPQNIFDPALQRLAEASPLADIRYGARLEGFTDHGDQVDCTLVDATTGGSSVLHARFVAGCDGSGSLVARLIGVDTQAGTMLACSTNIFIDCPELSQRTQGNRAYRYILMDGSGVWASMVNIDGRALWRLQVLGDAARPSWDESAAREVIDRAIGAPIDYTLRAIVPWTRRELVADHFARGNCFLVGDAAHQFSPTGGYGMNTGLSEAFDLSWKLAAVIEGWGGPRLLASYEPERRPVALRNARRATVNFTHMRATPGDPGVFDAGPQGAATRARLGRAVRGAMQDEWESLGIHLGYSYADSPIVCAEAQAGAGAGTADSPTHYTPSARPGARAPHVWLADGRSLLDLFGHGFVLLRFAPGTDVSGLLAAAERRGVPVTVADIADPAAIALYERALVLVRPDGHVAWRGDALPDDPLALIDHVRGGGAAVTA